MNNAGKIQPDSAGTSPGELTGLTSPPVITAAVCTPTSSVPPGIDWTPEKTERLINLFEAEVPLWNTKHPQHLDREERRVALLRISRDLKLAPSEVEKKLRGLRSYYSRELSKIQESLRNSSDDDGVYTSPWVFFTRLRFLNDFVHPRPPKRAPDSFYIDLDDYSKSTQQFDAEETDCDTLPQNPIPIRDSSLNGNIVCEQSYVAIKRDNHREMAMGSFSASSLLAESSTTSPPPLKRKARFNEALSTVDEHILYPAIRMVQPDSEADDEELCFGRHVALSLKKMSHWAKELAKLQIQQVLYKCYFSQSADSASAISQHQPGSLQMQQESRTLSPSPSTSSDYSSF